MNLYEIHRELTEKLEAAQDKPVMVTVTYLDSHKQLQHWIGTNRGFPRDDILASLTEIGKLARRDILSATAKATESLHRQLRSKGSILEVR